MPDVALFESDFDSAREQFDYADSAFGNSPGAYADGERDRRVWRISKLDENGYEGRANDVVGVASGRAFGNTLNWRYDLELSAYGRRWRLRFNDWMFLQADGVLINKAIVSKFGFKVGEVTIVFRKEGGPPPTASVSDQSDRADRIGATIL